MDAIQLKQTTINDYMILCKHPIIDHEWWEETLFDVRKSKKYLQFGYGIRLETNRYQSLELLRKNLPFKDHFYFLISNRHNREFPIHVDGIPGKNNAASVNWPLLNCDERSPTTWYSAESVIFKDLDNSFFMDNIKDAVEIHSDTMYDRYKLPYLFRSDILHRGYCNLNESGFRIIVKWELEFESWQRACQRFQDHNYI